MVAEIPLRIGERHVGKLAAGVVAVGTIIGPIGHSSARTQPNRAERSRTPERRNPARKRLKGFEPSTFCMASKM